jgi:hypothetical protein
MERVTMKTQIIKWSRAGVATLALSLTLMAHAEDDAIKSVELRLEGQCDANNSRLWLVNNHATKTINATLRWSLANSKRVVTDQFQVTATARLEIGCAAKAEIVSATYAP